MTKYWLFLCFITIISCKVEPQPIEYGADQCAACKMIIADSRFGCELVTTKGKVYKYDAIECLVPEVLKYGTDHYAHILVADFSNPGTMVEAFDARFMIDPSVPSPMGANLSAYAEATIPGTVETMDWTDLITELSGLERFRVR